MSDYWSKEKFDKRIKGYNDDLKMLRGHMKTSPSENTANLIKSLVQSKRYHQMANKILGKKKVKAE